MNITVTGGAGYIGSVLVPKLLNLNHHVTVLDNFMYGQTGLLGCCQSENFEVVRGDIRDPLTTREAVKHSSVLIHLAGIVGATACDSDGIAARTTNLGAVRSLLSLASSDQQIIFPCTNSGYGIGQEGILCDESTPMNPVSLYGMTKVDAEREVLSRENSVSLRLATVFGVSPRMRTDLLVNDFVYRAVTDRCVVVFEGDFKRNYIYIGDVADAFIHVIDNFDKMDGEAYNVGLSSANISKLELCELIKQQLPEFTYIESDIGSDLDKRNYIVSNEKIERTGFKASTPLEFGIGELIEAYKILGNLRHG